VLDNDFDGRSAGSVMRKPSVSAWARRSLAVGACIFGASALAGKATGQEKQGVGVGIGLCRPIELPHDKLPNLPAEQAQKENPPVDLPPQATRHDRPLPCVNTLAPLTLAVQSGVAVVTSGNFTGAIFGRLDGLHQQGLLLGVAVAGGDADGGSDGMMGLGRNAKPRAKRAVEPAPLTTYAMGTFAGGNRSESANAAGFNYDAVSGTAGLEYSISRNLIVGFAANATATRADINTGASVDVDALQAAAYASYATKNWFADALAAYGRHDLDLARPGVNDVIRGSTEASAVALAARGGYLFDFGRLRAGPIAGLTYIHSKVGGYTEKGDPQLTLNVSALTVDALTGSVGVRFLAPFQSGGRVFVPFLNVTLEHNFGDNTQTLSASLTQAPLAPVLSPVPSFDTRTYGKIDGGLTVQMGPQLGATISASSTFARDDAQDYRISAGLNYRF
jgi:outer membrane lipase/esterase